ncbi:uncharacterized protein rbbp8l [Salminus brasiliensis]|uniref:uncharacterized protein rbbp8l n=1 Tax=Salminus brasiliensis TaxID=930266 RepID=UPI003B833B40
MENWWTGRRKKNRKTRMAVQSFTELLHKLKEVHDQEVEGWQEKVLELTNKKNCDAKRLEELYNRNQQLREQQKMLTDNIKQLENMLRAGLCDRCTVTQEVAKKQQQDYESAQLQSLQHISMLMSEISALMKENEKLKEVVKCLRGRIEKQNGHPEEARSPEVKRSPDPAAAPLTPVTCSVLKPEQLSAGGATVSAATVKSESETTEALSERKEPSDKGAVHKRLQGWSGTYPFESSNLPTLMRVANTTLWRERRSVSVDSFEPRPSPPSPTLPSHLRLLKKKHFLSKERPQRVSAPLRPHPIKTAPPSIHWPLPECKDWAVMATVGSGAHPNISQDSRSTLLQFAGLVSPTGGLEPRPQSQDSSQPVFPPHRSLCELGESKERGATVSVIATPCWKGSAVRPERVFGENLREAEEEAPLDLSGAGGCKVKDTERTERAQGQPQCDMAATSSSSSSSSSPPAPLSSPSSAQYVSSPQSDPQTGDTKPQAWEKPKEESVQEKEKNGQFLENLKIPTLTISLRPVVVLESLKTAGQKEQDMRQSSSPQKEEDEGEEEEENDQSIVRKRPGQDNEAVSRRPMKEKRMRLTATPQGPNHGDSDQG